MNLPLVSVCITIYNSAAFVIETLQSVKEQTYSNIELIITDDCSADDSVELCRQWLAVNKHHFTRTELLTVPANTGVAANCNRGIAASQGEWIKFLAGDDVLLPGCIEDNMQQVALSPEATVFFSQVLVYEDEFKKGRFLTAAPEQYPMNLMNPVFSATDQYKLLLLSDRITYTPSSFFKKQTLNDLRGFDEENKLIEDYPMWLKLTRSGNRLFYFHKATVGYRRHRRALNNLSEFGLFKPLFLKAGDIRRKFVFPYLPWDIRNSEKHILTVSVLFQKAGMNKKTALFLMLYKAATIYLNPFRYIIFIKKRILKQGNTNIFYAD